MYKALYRQYRPKTFDEVIGQEHITTTLRNQIFNGNIGHAYLFSGTKGTGKTSTAKIFARAVNCIDLKDGNPCNSCEICKGILDESIMDVIEMDAASNSSVDDIRELRDKVQYAPAKAKYKVYIMDEVHMLSNDAFNALLKTLEEPPAHLIFILATTEAERLPQTILSRCQRFDFRRISTENIVLSLKNICNDLNIKYEESALQLIARNAEGAMRDSVSLLDQCISFNKDELTLKDSLEILGIANKDIIFNIVDNLKEKDLERTLYIVDDIVESGIDINQFIKDLILHFRNLMIAKSSKNPYDIIDMEEEAIKKYEIQAENMSLKFILKALDLLNEGESQAKWSTQPRIILEMSIIKLINLEDELSLEERVKKLEGFIRTGKAMIPEKAMERQFGRRDIQKNIEKPITKEKVDKKEEKVYIEEKIDLGKGKTTEGGLISEGTELEFNKVVDEWELILNYIRKENVVVYALLKEGSPLNIGSNLLTIGYKENFGVHKEALERKHQDFVNKVISSYFNKSVRVKFIMEDEVVNSSNDNVKDNKLNEVVDFFGEDFVEVKND